MDNLIDGISLNRFVSLAISEIAKGVSEATLQLENQDVLINPITDEKGFISTVYESTRRNVQILEFDLTVSVSSGNNAGAVGDIKVMGLFSFGGKAENTVNNLTTSKLKFAIPVSFPTNTKGVTPSENDRRIRESTTFR